MEIQNLNFYIFGYGLSNQSAADKIISLGGEVTIDDDDPSKIPDKYQRRLWQEADFREYDYLLLTPGVSLLNNNAHPIVEKAKQAKLKLICDIELFYLLNPKATYIAISGTNGKSTTASLIYKILQDKFESVYLGGNIGEAIFNLPIKQEAYYVLELSSFQLDLLDKAEFNYNILLNITPDHLDRYINFAHYIESKYRLFKCENQLQNHCLLFPSKCYYEDYQHKLNKRNITCLLDEGCGDFDVRREIFTLKEREFSLSAELFLQIGAKQNLIAAIILVEKLGLKASEISASLADFQPLEHRLELFCKYKNLQIFNDSKATNAESTKAAIEILDNIYLLLGGKAKQEGVIPLKSHLDKVKKIYLFGEAQDLFYAQLQPYEQCQKYSSMEEATIAALQDALRQNQPANILFSPAAASFDQFRNFAARGRAFKEIIFRELGGDENSK